MIERPFPKEFLEAVEAFAPDDPHYLWHDLIAKSDSDALAKLASAGYPGEVVEAYLNNLTDLSVDRLVMLSTVYGEFYSVVRYLLQYHGGKEAFEKALVLLESVDADERELGAEILMRQTGKDYPQKTKAVLIQRLSTGTDSVVLEVLACCIMHHEIDDCLKLLMPLTKHQNHRVRQAVAMALGVQSSIYAIEGLANLCLDQSADVRNWSVFTLKQVVQSYLEEDKLDMVPEPREIFYALLTDPDEEVRAEALAGLALYKDPRALPCIEAGLKERPVSALVLDAAGYMEHEALADIVEGLKEDDVWSSPALDAAREIYGFPIADQE
ncbi:MAG: hypothetical protein R3D26_16285 [Cyanobacteriota/Melainabacteria group bacterium]